MASKSKNKGSYHERWFLKLFQSLGLRIKKQPLSGSLGGELYTEDNLTTKRPAIGICPMRWDEMIGKISTKDYKVDDLIEG